MFCSKCGSQMQQDNKFCPTCGNETESTLDVVCETEIKTVIKQVEPKTYSFKRSKYLLGYTAVRYCTVYTDITIDNKEVQVEQWKSTFFKKYGRHSESIAAQDLNAVTIEKVYSWGWIVYLLICLGLGFFNPILWLFALVALLFLKRKKIYVFHKNGRIHIPDEGNIGMEKVKDMVEALKQMNPDINILSISDKV